MPSMLGSWVVEGGWKALSTVIHLRMSVGDVISVRCRSMCLMSENECMSGAGNDLKVQMGDFGFV